MFIGLVNYCRDHVPHMTELMKPLRDMHNPKSYKPSAKLLWSPERITAFETCHRAVSSCQELYFLEDDDVPIHVIRFFSKALTGAQLNWYTREKECYGIFYGVELFEAELDGRYSILSTDHKNLTYINATYAGKILR